MRLWETPVPIPNTTVKTQAADGTALETMWESRWLPDKKKEKLKGFEINRIETITESNGRRGLSSVGRAPALQAGGREFESLHLH